MLKLSIQAIMLIKLSNTISWIKSWDYRVRSIEFNWECIKLIFTFFE